MTHFHLSGLVTLALIIAALVTSQTWHRPHVSTQQPLMLASTQNFNGK